MAYELVDQRYQLEERLGAGAMAEVWRAFDTELERDVAMKILRESADQDRFEREARAVAALSHPNICQLFDCGTVEGRPYMVLEYLPNGTLEDRLQSRQVLADAETRRITTGVAAGLAHAHQRGIVHRDLKPANVLFDLEDRPKIADFGIAGMAGAVTLTDAGTVLGTAAYISPEQVQAEPATPASDVYSFGVILYRMLSGRLPFEADHPLELAEQHVRSAPPGVENLRSDAPADLANLATAALAKSPQGRPADGAALVAAINDPASPGSATTLLGDPPRQVLRSARRNHVARLTAGATAILALAAAGIALALLTTGAPAPASGTLPPTQIGRRLRSDTQSATTSPVAISSSTNSRPTTTAASTTRPKTTPAPIETARATTASPSPATTAPKSTGRTTTAATTPAATSTEATTEATTTTLTATVTTTTATTTTATTTTATTTTATTTTTARTTTLAP
jgi:serine/threonine protein kinase